MGSYLQAQGFTIRAYNYQQRCGEIDVIALQKDLLLFVEVKVRKALYGTIADLIGPSKQRKIIKTAVSYIVTEHFCKDLIYRFDVAVLKPEGTSYHLTYIPNAFTSRDNDRFI